MRLVLKCWHYNWNVNNFSGMKLQLKITRNCWTRSVLHQLRILHQRTRLLTRTYPTPWNKVEKLSQNSICWDSWLIRYTKHLNFSPSSFLCIGSFPSILKALEFLSGCCRSSALHLPLGGTNYSLGSVTSCQCLFFCDLREWLFAEFRGTTSTWSVIYSLTHNQACSSSCLVQNCMYLKMTLWVT